MVTFGILGAGTIARRFAASLAHVEGARLGAVSCRTQERADAQAKALGAHRAYAGHDALLADPDLDAIYLSLPHHLHHTWAIKALRARKAVLCEKPAMLTADEMREVASVAREEGVLFMEAMKPRFQPIYQRIVDAVQELGDPVRIEASLCNDMLGSVRGTDSYHMTPGPGAGTLLDCGTYCASWIEAFCPDGGSLTRFVGAQRDGIDTYVDATLSYGGDVTGRLECAFDRGKPRQVTFMGMDWRIVASEIHRPTSAVVYRDGKEPQAIDMPYEVDDFFGEVSHFVGLLREGRTESPVMPLSASIGCAAILDTIRPALTVTPQALDVLAEQERALRYPERFGAAEAFDLGRAVRGLADDYDRGYVVRIVRERDGYDLFRWGSDDKRPANYDYAEGKRQASLRLGHCSLWGWTEAMLGGAEGQPLSDADLPVGGAFPIWVGDERVATACVSGLHEGLDHELLVRALCRVLGRDVPAYPCIAG